MKVLHVSTLDKGGAAIAALRLHKRLVAEGISSSFLTSSKSRNDIANHFEFTGTLLKTKPPLPALTLSNYLQEKVTGHYRKELLAYEKLVSYRRDIIFPNTENDIDTFEMFSFADSAYDITSTACYQEADIIHLHWVAGFLDYESFFDRNKKPIVWTLHDENPILGAFHYQADKERNRHSFKDIDREIQVIKKKSISKQDKLLVVSPSNWLRGRALKSDIFENRNICTIRNGLDTAIFKSQDKMFSREVFGLPEEKTVILFISEILSNFRKGMDLLLPIINDKELEDLYFVFIGSGNPKFTGSNIKQLGVISDERLMALAYNSADAFVLSSREDNLPNTMIESLCCGIPVIAFPIGDNKEIISTTGGVIADETSSVSLKKALISFIDNKKRFNPEKISEQSQKKFTDLNQATSYMTLYKELMNKS